MKKRKFWDAIDFKLAAILALILAFMALALVVFLGDAQRDRITELQADVTALEESHSSMIYMINKHDKFRDAEQIHYRDGCIGEANIEATINAILDYLDCDLKAATMSSARLEKR